MANNIVENLKQKKREFSTLQQREAERQGELNGLLRRLKDEYNLTSVKEAKRMREDITASIGEKEKELTGIDNKMEEILEKAQRFSGD